MGKRGPAPKRYRYKNKFYSTEQLAEMAGISRNAMYARINYNGYSIAKALETARLRTHEPAPCFAYAGHNLTLREWSELVGVPRVTLLSRLRNGWTLAQALATPTPKQRRRGGGFQF